MHNLLSSESAGRDSSSVAAAVAFTSGRNAVAEIRAGYSAFNPFRSARSVALSRTSGHIKGTGLRGIKLGAFLACALQTVGIAEASGLDFLHRGVHRWRDRTPREISRMQELGARSSGSHLELGSSERIDHHLRRFLWFRRGDMA